MKLSIIIPNYNDAKFIPQCLDSLINQKLNSDEFEIIIVNDGSTDNSLEVIQDYAKKHSEYKIKIIDKENGGISVARNTAMQVTKGKYIYFVDSDDYIAANTLHIALENIEKYDLDILTFDCLNTASYEHKESRNIESINTKLKVTDGLTYIANKNYHNAVWSYIVNKGFLTNTKLEFITNLTLEDCVFTPNLFLKAQNMAHLNIDVYRYLQLNTNSVMRNNNHDNLNKNIKSHIIIMAELNKLIDSIDGKKSTDKKAIDRFKNRQQTLLFFLISKLVKTNYPFNELKTAISSFEELGAYPLNNFISDKYNGMRYEVLSRIFGYKTLLFPFTKIYRKLKGIS
jgi:glycosyltransferase involved in cell wall biosynthesis